MKYTLYGDGIITDENDRPLNDVATIRDLVRRLRNNADAAYCSEDNLRAHLREAATALEALMPPLPAPSSMTGER